MGIQRYSDATTAFLQAIQIHNENTPVEYYAGLCESYIAQKKLLKAVGMVIQIETINEKSLYCINYRLLTIVPTIEISKIIIEYKCKRYKNAINMAQQVSPSIDFNICHYIISKALYYTGEFEKATTEIEHILAQALQDSMAIPIYLLMKYKLEGLIQKVSSYCDTAMQSIDHTDIAQMIHTHTDKKLSQMSQKKVFTNSIVAIENIISTRGEYAQTLIMAANQGVSQSQIKGMLCANNQDIKLGL
jgi:tetratricopeptide (TPR) repeat protein